MSVGTAFHPRTSEMNKKLAWGEWAGYFAAAVYADFHDIEYNAIREAAAAIDVSPLFKYLVTGPDAGRLVDRVITRDASKLAVDQVFYTPWCDERGKVIDDGTITRRDESTFFWTAADPSYRWFKLNATGLDVDIQDVSEAVAGLALQGPKSRAILESATGEDWSDVRYFRGRATRIGDADVHVTRTGYTGDLGYELWVDVEQAVGMWDALFAAGEAYGIRPAGIRALDVARLEAGLILIEVEYTSVRHAVIPEQEYSPSEIGLGRLVDLHKGPFVGRQALLAGKKAGGPPRRLVGLEIDWSGIEALFAAQDLPPEASPMVSREHIPVFAGGQQVGRLTSHAWGPTLKKMIGLASVPPQHARRGSRLQVEWTVEAHRGKVNAKVVDLPFFDPPRKRA